MSSPFEQYESDNPKHWDCLYDIPPWEWEGIIGWIREIFVVNADGYGHRETDCTREIVARIQRRYRIMFDDIGVDYGDWFAFSAALRSKRDRRDELDVIMVIELIVKYIRDDYEFVKMYHMRNGHGLSSSEMLLSYLNNMLSNGSKWRVVFKSEQIAGLVECVDENIVNVATEMNNDDLNKAWSHAFGVGSSDPDLAVKSSVRALESILSEAGVQGGTLGREIKWLRDNSEKVQNIADTQFAARENEYFDSNTIYKWLRAGLDIVQKTDTERHGTKASCPKVTRKSAQQAVIIATMLCELIKEGYFYVK